MNTINNSARTHAQLMLDGKSSQNTTCGYRGNPFEDNRYQLPFFGNRCEPELPADGLQAIVEQFTSLLSSVFSALDNTIQGLLGMIKEPVQQPSPTPETPPAQTPGDAPNADMTAPSEPETRTKKEAEVLSKSGEFLWKPVSEKDGKLAVVLPGNLTGKVKNVKIVDADGKVLGKGKYSGTGNPLNNGEREHYRFDKEGKKFPDGCFVEITLNNGNVKKLKIKETSERFSK